MLPAFDTNEPAHAFSTTLQTDGFRRGRPTLSSNENYRAVTSARLPWRDSAVRE
ncbi:hypothetical protein PAMC26510_09870 [Caballeronia sordidicola]|uniref:Uncharacterized protein n=1 Tax=Caballeronia sordidicola TaxID=196367 RepID=A0A242MZ35_CABSO|nr:hypothetical protein PAMC26510_09870 [Caballeronia sordidicola]